MSFSFREPEWPAFCECKYDEARDEMDREDCQFHCNDSDDSAEQNAQHVQRKTPTRARKHSQTVHDHGAQEFRPRTRGTNTNRR
jgi:hypothetical protein